MSSTQFLDKLQTAEKTCGLYLFPNFLGVDERGSAFEVFNGANFPWDLKPKLYGIELEQHAYYFDRKPKKFKGNEALSTLEMLCQRLEKDFDINIVGVFCNRLQDQTHNLPWHKDSYGAHIFVLSLGSQRTIEFRESKTGVVESLRPSEGDMYLLPLGLNKTHQHRVCPGKDGDGTRISLVFFFRAPKYAKDFKISFREKVTGFMETLYLIILELIS